METEPLSTQEVVRFVRAGGFARVWLAHCNGVNLEWDRAEALADRLRREVGCKVLVVSWSKPPGKFYDLVLYLAKLDGCNLSYDSALAGQQALAVRILDPILG